MAHRASPGMASGSRLVVSTRTDGHRSRSCSARAATPAIRCWQLSITSRASESASVANTRSAAVMPGRNSRALQDCRWPACPAPRAPRGAAWLSSVIGASSTSQTPSRARSTQARRPGVARRVLPAPPGPTIVVSRAVSRSAATRQVSASRPTKLETAARRLVRRAGIGSSGWMPRSSRRCCPATSATGIRAQVLGQAVLEVPDRRPARRRCGPWPPVRPSICRQTVRAGDRRRPTRRVPR